MFLYEKIMKFDASLSHSCWERTPSEGPLLPSHDHKSGGTQNKPCCYYLTKLPLPSPYRAQLRRNKFLGVFLRLVRRSTIMLTEIALRPQKGSNSTQKYFVSCTLLISDVDEWDTILIPNIWSNQEDCGKFVICWGAVLPSTISLLTGRIGFPTKLIFLGLFKSIWRFAIFHYVVAVSHSTGDSFGERDHILGWPSSFVIPQDS